jgi:hypothetical protein
LLAWTIEKAKDEAKLATVKDIISILIWTLKDSGGQDRGPGFVFPPSRSAKISTRYFQYFSLYWLQWFLVNRTYIQRIVWV